MKFHGGVSSLQHGVSPSPPRNLRAHEIQTGVLAALFRSGYASLYCVACEVDDNQVILHGSVPSYHLKQLAQVFAQRVDGVERIENRLKVLRCFQD